MKLGYVYLLQVYPAGTKQVYKYGKTARHFTERFKDYKQAQPIILLVLSCKYCDKLEKETLKLIKEQFTMRPDIGREYFEGDLNKIKKTIINKYREHVREHPCIEETDNEVTDKDTVLDFINGTTNNMTESIVLSIGKILEGGEITAEELAKVAMTVDNRRFLRYLSDEGYDIFGNDFENYFNAPTEMKIFIKTLLPSTIKLPPSASNKKIVERLLNDHRTGDLVDNDTIKWYLEMCVFNYEYENFKLVFEKYKGSMDDFEELIPKDELHWYKGHAKRQTKVHVDMIEFADHSGHEDHDEEFRPAQRNNIFQRWFSAIKRRALASRRQ